MHWEAIAAYWLSSSEQGLIVVDSPRIFTRGRLVNDRSREADWLDKQLKRTDDLIKENAFTVNRVLSTEQRITLSARSNSVEQAEANTQTKAADIQVTNIDKTKNDTKKNDPSTIDWSLQLRSPIDEYERALEYRRKIRTELMSTSLDDRHDINGNTIFRLNFNVAVIPPPGSRKTAIITTTISESREENHYKELIDHWQQHLNELKEKLIQDRIDTLEKGGDFSGEDNNLFQIWLGEKIRAKLTKLSEKGRFVLSGELNDWSESKKIITESQIFLRFFSLNNWWIEKSQAIDVVGRIRKIISTSNTQIGVVPFERTHYVLFKGEEI
jgi:hypothetical protein